MDYKEKVIAILNSQELSKEQKEKLENIFPELKEKESEDERIRKAIKKALQVRCDGSRIISDEPITLEEAIAWLEKQGNKSVNIDVESIVSSYEQRLKSQGGTKYSPLVNMCLTAFRHGVENVLEELNLKKLEKQSEQKPTLPKWKYKKDHIPLLKDSLILNKYGCVAKSPSGAIVSDVWVLDYDELVKLPKEELEKLI